MYQKCLRWKSVLFYRTKKKRFVNKFCIFRKTFTRCGRKVKILEFVAHFSPRLIFQFQKPMRSESCDKHNESCTFFTLSIFRGACVRVLELFPYSSAIQRWIRLCNSSENCLVNNDRQAINIVANSLCLLQLNSLQSWDEENASKILLLLNDERGKGNVCVLSWINN